MAEIEFCFGILKFFITEKRSKHLFLFKMAEPHGAYDVISRNHNNFFLRNFAKNVSRG